MKLGYGAIWMYLLICGGTFSLLTNAPQSDLTIRQTNNDSLKKDHKFTVNGYIKYLEQISFVNDITNLQTLDLLHNRLNFKYQPNDHLIFRLEVRNRIYYGA